jgi:hypothetical protein
MFDRILSAVGVLSALAVIYGFAIRSVVLAFPGVSIPDAYDSTMFFVMQAIVVVSLIGSLNAYRKHSKVGPPILATISAAAVIYGINSQLDIYFMFPGMVGMLAVSAWNSIELRWAAEAAE